MIQLINQQPDNPIPFLIQYLKAKNGDDEKDTENEEDNKDEQKDENEDQNEDENEDENEDTVQLISEKVNDHEMSATGM